jgi:LacI family transcriptional regulator
MAVGALRELHDAGMRVPQDVSVTGFDNIELAEYLNPALTTANIPRRQIGRMIFDALTPNPDRIAQDQEALIEPELVVRESTAKAKG